MDTTSLISRTDDSKSKRPDPHNLLLIGGGPRGVAQATAEVAFMILYKSHFDHLSQIGAQYQINTTIVEKYPVFGIGAPFCCGQTGMMNTGIEDDNQFPLPVPSSFEDKHQVNMFLSYKQRYDHMLATKASKDDYYEEVKKFNVPGAVLFKKSLSPASGTPEGQLDHGAAYLMRRTVGQEQGTTFDRIQQVAKSALPFYNLDSRHSSTVHRIQVDKDGKHIAMVQRDGSEEIDFISADQMRLNTGTTTINPIPDQKVRKLAFCDAMNAFDFKEHCSKHQLLDKDGFMRPGIKMLSGGTGLSGLDQLSVLNHCMNLFEEDETDLLGYRVREEAKTKYQGAINIMSRTPGKVAPPRHASGFEWLQGTPVMGSTKHIHALFLHSAGEEVFGIWMDILKAAIARARYRTPDQVSIKGKQTKEVERLQFEESKWFLECRQKAGKEEKLGRMDKKEYFLKESTRTLYGAWRQAALSLIFGFGLEANAATARAEMREYAPLSWKGREFWLIHRAQMSSITNQKFACRESNMHLVKNFSELMQHVTASPVEVHSMFHLLSEAGIVRHVQASYVDVHSDGEKVQLRDEEFDGLLVSPCFDRNENEVIQSLAGQVKPYREEKPTYGEVGKFRRLVDVDGNPVSIEDHGLGGKGFSVEAEDGGRSLISSFATDVNNRGSALSTASSCTLRRMAMAHLSAAGVTKPAKVMDELYEKSKPGESAFDEEVRKFKVHFEDAFEMWAYLEAIKFLAGDDAEYFRNLFDAGLTRSARKEQMQNLATGATPMEKQAFVMYKAKIKETPVFKPPRRDEYLARFVDTTDEEDVFMYNGAYDMALRCLEARSHPITSEHNSHVHLHSKIFGGLKRKMLRASMHHRAKA